MAVDKSVIGRPTGNATVTVERGPVAKFADSVKDESAVYHDARAATEAGFDGIPIPPTYAFSALGYWGSHPEDQPADDPAKGSNPMMEIIGGLRKGGGIILHGEQDFEYVRPVVVGETLHKQGRVADIYEKESKGATMTFIVTEDTYSDVDGHVVLRTRMNLIHRA